MKSMPPPGHEGGSWGFSEPDDERTPPPPSNRLLRLAAGLGVLLVVLVIIALLHDDNQVHAPRASGASASHGAAALRSPTAFRRRAVQLCREMKQSSGPFEKRAKLLLRRAQRVLLSQGLTSAATREAYGRAAREALEPAVRIAQKALQRLKGLSAPEELAHGYDRLLGMMVREVQLTQAFARALELGDFASVDRIQKELKALYGPSRRLAGQLGVGVCERPGQA